MSSINEFKLVGAGYIAKNGDSANAGTDPLLPKAHPADAGMPGTYVDEIVVGSGVYAGSVPGGTSARRWTGDGEVIFDLNGGSIAAIGASPPVSWTNIFFKNGSVNNIPASYSLINCKLLNCAVRFRFQSSISGCIFLDDFINIDTGASSVSGNIFLGSSLSSTSIVGTNVTFRRNFLAKNKSLVIPNYTSRSSFTNNMINGLLSINGTNYELKQLFDGSPRPDADPLIPDLIDLWSDVYTRGNYAGDPKFLDVVGRIVDPSSDLLKRNVGNVKPGRITTLLGNSDPNTQITLQNVTQAGNGYMVTPGQPWGKITIVTRESTSVVELGTKAPIVPLNFDSDEIPGSISNNNVPDSFPLTDPGVNPGKLPNRLTYLLRTSQRNQMPTQDSHWDNDAAAGGVAGAYYVQEWFTKPTLTQTLGITYGNAEPEGYGGTVNAINARWTEYTIYLRNDRDY